MATATATATEFHVTELSPQGHFRRTRLLKSKLSISGMLTVHLNHPSKLGIPKQSVELYVDFETTGRIYYKDSSE